MSTKMSKSNACVGTCCAAFTLAYSPSALARLPAKRFQEVEQIRDMVIYLGKHKRNPVAEQTHLGEGKSHFYTCKFFDAEARLCVDYENRPAMCRDFPYQLPTCPYVGCRHYNGKLRRLRVLSNQGSKDAIFVDKEEPKHERQAQDLQLEPR